MCELPAGSGMKLCLLIQLQKPTVEWKRVVLNF